MRGARGVGSPVAGVLAEREGESLRRRLVLCLDGLLRMRQAPFTVASFPSEHCPLRLADPAPTSLHILRGPVPVSLCFTCS